MSIAYSTYKLITSGLFLCGFPLVRACRRFTGRFRDDIDRRLGNYPPGLLPSRSGRTRIWIHAVSVGEVKATVPIISALKRLIASGEIIVSTSTSRGQVFAREILSDKAVCIYMPVDYIGAVRKALSEIQPDVLALMETEIWPNLLVEANKRGIKTAVVNGRISLRTIRRYLKIRPLMKETLRRVDAFSLISKEDADRFLEIGALSDRITVAGNSKFDLSTDGFDDGIHRRMTKRYQVIDDEPVIVAGSTRRSEETIVLDAFEAVRRDFPEALLILAPRHVERSRMIADLVRRRGFSYQFRTELDRSGIRRDAPVVILDTIGELQAVYSIATLAFCGGSLVPLGGQNILEPAMWGRPVIYGPSMEDFRDAKLLLEKEGGGIPVADGEELAEKFLYYLHRPLEAERAGKAARKAVVSNQGAGQRHARVIRSLCPSNPAHKK